MVSIQGLPPAIVHKQRAAQKKKSVAEEGTGQEVSAEASQAATALAHSVKTMDPAEYAQAQVQYDLPEGKSRDALAQYFDVMNQAKREELAKLMGVDIYI